MPQLLLPPAALPVPQGPPAWPPPGHHRRHARQPQHGPTLLPQMQSTPPAASQHAVLQHARLPHALQRLWPRQLRQQPTLPPRRPAHQWPPAQAMERQLARGRRRRQGERLAPVGRATCSQRWLLPPLLLALLCLPTLFLLPPLIQLSSSALYVQPHLPALGSYLLPLGTQLPPLGIQLLLLGNADLSPQLSIQHFLLPPGHKPLRPVPRLPPPWDWCR